jgi:putative NADH-flavin reductase
MKMKMLVFGATGGTGRCVVEQALASGHDVTAVVRAPARMRLRHERMRVTPADVFETEEIEPTLAGADAVVSALGPRSYRAQSTVCSLAVSSILSAMQEMEVRRFVCVSAAPVGSVDKGDRVLYRFVARPLLRLLFKGLYDDLAAMEEKVRQSGTAWTIFRPPRLTDGPVTGRYRIAPDHNVSGGYSISRADLAEAILQSLDDPGSVGTTFGIGY